MKMDKYALTSAWRYQGEICILSANIRHKIGISDTEHSKLITFNDKKRYSFKRIATWIDENL